MDVWQAMKALDLTPPFDYPLTVRPFRLKSKEAHPDKGGTKEAFHALTLAKETLIEFAKKNVDIRSCTGVASNSSPCVYRFDREEKTAYNQADHNDLLDFISRYSRAYNAFEKFPAFDFDNSGIQCTHACLPFIERVQSAVVCTRCRTVHVCDERTCGARARCASRMLSVGAAYRAKRRNRRCTNVLLDVS